MDRWKKWLALVSITALVVLTLLGGIVSAMAGEGKKGPGEEQAVTEETESPPKRRRQSRRKPANQHRYLTAWTASAVPGRARSV
jgi:hypothetical protein